MQDQSLPSFDIQLANVQIQQALLQTSQSVNEVLKDVTEKLRTTEIKGIFENLDKNKPSLNPFLTLLQGLLLNSDQTFEESILSICEIVSRITQAAPELLNLQINELLLHPLVLNTAHPLSSVRKNSRSCIANYVRQYKDLRPILKAFTEHGILKNTSAYSKQCIILILPNLLNLDPSVISTDCQEFVELCQAIIQQLENNEEEVSKSITKVISEMLKRFPNFEKIHKNLSEQAKNRKQSKEESKVNNNVPMKLSQTQKQKSKEYAFGFIEQPLFQRMSQNLSLQDKTKAFEEALTILQTNKPPQQIRIVDFLTFLMNFLSETNQSQYATINTFALRMLNFVLATQDHEYLKQFSLSKLSTLLAGKLVDNNKLVRQEAHLFYAQVQKIIGLLKYFQQISTILDGFCSLATPLSSQQQSTVDSLLNLLLSSSQKVKGKNEIDFMALVQTLSSVVDADSKQQSKIIEILFILQGCIDQEEIMNEARAVFKASFIDKLEERLCIVKERRNLSIVNPTTPFQIQKTQSEVDSATLRKKQNLLLPNINHLSTQQRPTITTQINIKSSTNATRTKVINNQDYFAQTEQTQSKTNLIKPISKRYDSTTESAGGHPQSPFTATTTSSLSGKLHLIKKQQSIQSDEISQNNSNYGSFSVNSGLSKHRYNSQSHQILPQVIQKNNSQTEKNPMKASIVANKLISKRDNTQMMMQSDQSGSNIIESNQSNNGGKLTIDPSFFQQTNGSLSNSIIDAYSSKASNKPGSGFASSSIRFMRGTATSLGECSSNNGENKYLAQTELEPLVNVELEWKLCLGEIKSDNWSRQFEACNTLRRVFKYHVKEIIFEGKQNQTLSKTVIETFHDINQSLIKQVESLRSSVAKQAMITLNEMFEAVPKQVIEQDLDNMVTSLIKKSIDSNIFMAEEAEKTLISMCRNLPEQKMLGLLLVNKSNKSSMMRNQICRSITAVYIRIKQNQKQKKQTGKISENERQILIQLGTYLSDQTQEVRNQAKTSLKQVVNLYDEKELLNILSYTLNDQSCKKVQDFIDNGSHLCSLLSTKEDSFDMRSVEVEEQVNEGRVYYSILYTFEESATELKEPIRKTSNAVESNSHYADPAYAKYKGVLQGAEKGKVVTRFPPEPSGYLHIGHVKAAMLNYHYSKMYDGIMILRFDDTNPMNEKIEFVENIIRDLKTLKIYPDKITYTSDYFDQTKEYMEKFIQDGLAYADDTPAEEMKKERDEGIESKYRTASVEDNLKRFHLMLKGKHDEEVEEEKKDPKNKEEKKTKKEDKKKEKDAPVPVKVQSDWCMRAKIDMQHKVKCLRDPVFYRIKKEAHHRTGTKYFAYPTYDFACPIVDALEDVTHCLRTIEYHDRNAMYEWAQEKLGLRKVTIYDYSRLNLVSTILSKRSLKWFVEENIAEGWNDPRFPTVQGIMRRGLTVEALKNFMLEQGPSKNTNLMEWDKLWALNKDFIDPITPRYTAIVKSTACKLHIENGPEVIEGRSQALHPKNESLGTKAVIYGKELWVEKDDAAAIEEGEKITLMKWGNVTITKKEVDGDNITLYGKVDPADKDFKKTKKITWVCADEDSTVEVTLVELDHLITKKKVEENDDVKSLVNHNSRIEYTAIAEGCLRNIQQGESIQLERRGFFFVDQASFLERKIRLNFIPDGKTKAMSVISHKLDAKEVAGGKGKIDGANKAEQKKKALADGAQQPEASVEGGEEKKLSKKDLKKQAKKESKKAGGKKEEGGEGHQHHGHHHKKPAAAEKVEEVVEEKKQE